MAFIPQTDLCRLPKYVDLKITSIDLFLRHVFISCFVIIPLILSRLDLDLNVSISTTPLLFLLLSTFCYTSTSCSDLFIFILLHVSYSPFSSLPLLWPHLFPPWVYPSPVFFNSILFLLTPSFNSSSQPFLSLTIPKVPPHHLSRVLPPSPPIPLASSIFTFFWLSALFPCFLSCHLHGACLYIL